ncbi:alpha/beta hydrolase [Parafrankia sp. BMG5.11]|nr:alpha/beta hydrolase [Parafrankia sp. Ea1.12]TCJ35589.1 alpha/beta hydrolase [Parafrankia sp. BMG5.11]
MTDLRPVLHVPARDVPVPTSVSAEAQAVLAMPPMQSPGYPPLDDLDGWRTLIADHDRTIGATLSARAADAPVRTEELDLGPFRVHDITPIDLSTDDDRVYLDIHGGAFIYGAGEACRAMAVGTATRAGIRVWAVDYRMPPDHPFPAALDDCLATYRALLEECQPERIVVGGSSAGGNLAAALILRARDEGLPLPAGAVLKTPVVDLTESGDSIQTNLGLDPLLPRRSMPAFLLYAAGHDLKNPYVSPLFGDFTKGFVSTILTTGTRDLLLSDSVRMHRALRAAGVDAHLHVTEAGGHGGFFGMAPEDDAIQREIRQFVDSSTGWRSKF